MNREYIGILETENAELKQENKQLKMIVNEYERLNKGFKITNVQEYNIDELLSYRKYKDNWNKLKEWLYENYYLYIPEIARNSTYQVVLNKMQDLEQGSDNK